MLQLEMDFEQFTFEALSVGSLGLRNRTRNALWSAGCFSLADVLALPAHELRRRRGFGVGCWVDLERALEDCLPGLTRQEASRIRAWVAAPAPAPVRAPAPAPAPPPGPLDARSLLFALEDYRHKPSVRIMTHRLGLDGDVRRTIQETMQALGVTRNAITLADFRVSDHLRRTQAAALASGWVAQVVERGGGLATFEELSASLDPTWPKVPGQLGAALRLLERVLGRGASWDLLDGVVLTKELHALGKPECALPCLLSDLAPLVGGGSLAPERLAALIERVWRGTLMRLPGCPPVVLSLVGTPSLRSHAAAHLLLDAPLPQRELEQRLGGGDLGARLWGALAREPRAVKTGRSIWDWAPRLGLSQAEQARWADLCHARLEAAEAPVRVRDLCGPVGATSPSLLHWTLKRDPRFQVDRSRVSLRSANLLTPRHPRRSMPCT